MDITEQISNELINYEEVAFEGICHDCATPVQILCSLNENNEIIVEGGAIYNPKIRMGKQIFLKCNECFIKNKILTNFMPCEVYSRVVGYLRPISQWNPGKTEEYKKRKDFKVGGEQKE